MVSPVTRELDRKPEGGKPDVRERRFADLLLTAPIFVVYHFGVVFLDVRNGLDPITDLVLSVLHRSLLAYLGLTLGLALVIALAARLLGISRRFQPAWMALRLGEALVYAFVMAFAARSVASFTLGPKGVPGNPAASLVMSFGAGFYEEIAFRVILFGGVVWLVRRAVKGKRAMGFELGWALIVALVFSAIHYVGPLSDSFSIGSFVFRATCGLVLTAVYRLRGFATAVWTHALYDVGVMVF
ncbi:MAG: CPBP family intramembrane glutamic endopeptidase [Polyangiales bacterium]